ncbi:glycosyltransferase family 4 protein [Bacteroides sp.]
MQKIIRITTVPQSLKTLLKGQLRFMSQYYEVIAVSSDGDCFGRMLEEQGVRGIRISMTRKISPFQDLISLFELIHLFLKEKPDIVHTHTPKAGTLGMLAAWITRVPHRLHTVAGLPLLATTGKKRRLLNVVEKLTYACATKIYPNSFVMERIILDNHFTHQSKLKVIANGSSNGIDTSFFSPTTFLEHKNLQKKTYTFCFIGRVVKDKGINELTKAFVRLYGTNNNVELIIIGPFEKKLDPVLPEVEELILNHPAIFYKGFQNDVRPFLINADAFVFPSYREGFPNVVMQAGAMGVPSIVTDINGCNEIIADGVNGRIIPAKDENALYDMMKYFIDNPIEVKQMADKVREMITSRYEQQIVWEALLMEYRSLLKK